MHTNHYYIEMMLKERQQQFLAEAKLLRLVKAATPDGSQNRKSILGIISQPFETMRATLQRRHEPMACSCPVA